MTTSDDPKVMTVSRYLAGARVAVERTLPLAWVAGEVTNLYRAGSGHVYFDLKDPVAQVKCTLWRQKAQAVGFALRNGIAVEVRATATLYEPRGEFQLNVDTLRLAGLGALYERFARLKARLQEAGWFAADRKRSLPAFPRTVGVVTSPRGAALRDVLTTLGRRWPAASIVVYPSGVQGAMAAPEVAQAIRLASARREVDVLIVCRGGGSIEDLWAFNEERVAQAILECAVPVVTGIGHETDFTIADFVADLRAPTPTGAAAAVVPDRNECAQRAADLARRLSRAGEHACSLAAQRVDIASRRLVHPVTRITLQRRVLADLAARLERGWGSRVGTLGARTDAAGRRLWRELRTPLEGRRPTAGCAERLVRCASVHIERLNQRVDALSQHLAHLNPSAVLERGYAIVADTKGVIVQDAAAIAPGDHVTLTFARGSAEAAIERTRS